jgi:hypothetical protein
VSRIYCIDNFGRVLQFTHIAKFKGGAHAGFVKYSLISG